MTGIDASSHGLSKLKEAHDGGNSLKLDTHSPSDESAIFNPITPESAFGIDDDEMEVVAVLNSQGDVSDVNPQVPAENTSQRSASTPQEEPDAIKSQGNNRSSPPQIPKKETPRKQKLITKMSPVPAPIGVRGRVVSLDRRGYILHDGDDQQDEDDDLSSSQNSSDDDGSYFSEHHLSPKYDKTGFMLPPRRSSTGMNNLPSDKGLHHPVQFQRSQTYHGGFNASKTHDSDLSLSSSSNDELTLNKNYGSLSQPYPLIKTNSAPESFRPSKPFRSLRPRSDSISEVDLGPVERDASGNEKPPMPGRETNSSLQVIASSEDANPRPESVNRFSSGSSFVSSSSEDGATTKNPRFVNDVVQSDGEEGGSNVRRKHRRQHSHHSYRSVDSETSSLVEAKPSNMNSIWRNDDVESELSDADSSFVKLNGQRGFERQPSLESSNSRIPLEIPSPSAIRSKSNKPLLHSGLNEEQLKVWRSGSSEASNGVKRNNSLTSLQSGGMLQYSEDDTDESAKQKDFLLAIFSDKNDAMDGGTGRIERRSSGSFTKDLSNSSSKVELSSKTAPTEADHSSNPSVDFQSSSNMSKGSRHVSVRGGDDPYYAPPEKYLVYWQRWLMLMYISILNLLSDWTCYSIAPIAVLTSQAFGDINPEHLVTIFLASNAIATAMEPIILSRLGLRKTVVFGSFLLMCGSVIKSGGIPGIIGTELNKDDAQWRIPAGFLLVGLSQPLYQCTPTLLSCSWFPEKERTFATGVALNSNQLGIGFAFVFGMQVLSSDDIPSYFGLLSTISTLAFIGCFLQFKDAPPTPPSETARVMRGSLEVKIPYIDTMPQALPVSFRNGSVSFAGNRRSHRKNLSGGSGDSQYSNPKKSGDELRPSRMGRRKSRSSENRGSPTAAFKSQSRPSSRMTRRSSAEHRQRRNSRSSGARSATAESGLVSNSSNASKKNRRRKDVNKMPSPSNGLESTSESRARMNIIEQDRYNYETLTPSPTRLSRRSNKNGNGNSGCSSSSPSPRRISRRRSSDGRLKRSRRPSLRRSASEDSGLVSNSSVSRKNRKRRTYKILSPSSRIDSPIDCRSQINIIAQESKSYGAFSPPSPMMNGRVRPSSREKREREDYYDSTPQRDPGSYYQPHPYSQQAGGYVNYSGFGPQDQAGSMMYHLGHTPAERTEGGLGFPPDTPFANLSYPTPPMHHPYTAHRQQAPYAPYETQTHFYQPNPQYMHHNTGMHPHPFHQYQQNYMYPMPTMYMQPPQYHYPRSVASSQLPATSVVDDGAEPVLSQAGNNIDIEIRDDQVFRSIKACFSRKGFIHTVVAFAASGIVLNTLSTYMDYLVRLDGSGRQMVGIIGGSFQILVMISSMVVGKFTDRTRAYFSIIIGLLVFGAFALAECGINLDAARGNALKWSLLLAALLVGPLQPISTELAVDVAFPLCSNTVLVIQQLVSNLCSALFIPLFQSLNDVGKEVEGFERPQYTFSFYMLIVIHALATVFFATFNGRYMRLAHEQRNNSDVVRNRSSSGSTSRDKYGPAYDEEKAALI